MRVAYWNGRLELVYKELTGHFRLWHDPGSFAFLFSFTVLPYVLSKMYALIRTDG